MFDSDHGEPTRTVQSQMYSSVDDESAVGLPDVIDVHQVLGRMK